MTRPKITPELIHRCASVCHSHFGINAKPSHGDLEFTKHVLAAAIIGGVYKTNKEVQEAIDLHNEQQ